MSSDKDAWLTRKSRLTMILQDVWCMVVYIITGSMPMPKMTNAVSVFRHMSGTKRENQGLTNGWPHL